MADTLEGGAYQSPDGSWHNAEGQPLKPAQIKEAQQLADEQAAQLDATEVHLLQAQANRDPVARALSGFLQQQVALPAKKE